MGVPAKAWRPASGWMTFLPRLRTASKPHRRPSDGYDCECVPDYSSDPHAPIVTPQSTAPVPTAARSFTPALPRTSALKAHAICFRARISTECESRVHCYATTRNAHDRSANRSQARYKAPLRPLRLPPVQPAFQIGAPSSPAPGRPLPGQPYVPAPVLRCGRITSATASALRPGRTQADASQRAVACVRVSVLGRWFRRFLLLEYASREVDPVVRATACHAMVPRA